MYSWKELACALVVSGGLLVMGATTVIKGSATWKQQKCASNLKGIQQLAAAYQNDHDGTFQPVILQTKPRWTFWYSFVAKYGSNPSVFYCPANPKAEKILMVDDGESDLLPAVLDQVSISYGMNFCLSTSGGSESAKADNVKLLVNPATTIYFGDSKTLTLRPTKWCWKEDYAPIHEGASNFVYVDGHVETLNETNLGTLQAFDEWKRDTTPWKNWK